MTAAIIGIGSGMILILFFHLLPQLEKVLLYGLVLTGIGFIYVGFTWSNWQAMVASSLQAVFFLLLTYVGIKKTVYLLAGGYILHGTWDLVYPFFFPAGLLPPHYDLFCLSIDFTIGFYILFFRHQLAGNIPITQQRVIVSPIKNEL